MNHPIRLPASLLVIAILLVACGTETPPTPSESLAKASEDSALEHAQKHLDPKYVCPMHPQIVRDEEGTCPICGMNLVAQNVSTESGNDDGPPIVRVRPETVQNMGVRTAKAETGRLWKRIDTLGRVMYDEDRQIHVHPRAEGWVEKLYIRSVGDPVSADQVLLELYAPDVVNAQEEYLLAIKDRDSGALKGRRNLVDSSVQRLKLFDVPGQTIKQIENTGKVALRVPIRAEKGGVVTQIGLREGMYVTPMTELYTISDIGKVWVLVDVFEHQMGWFEVGTSADITLPALPGETFSGKVQFVYPELDPKTRTLRVRLEFDNPDGKLKPNMLAEATIWGGAKDDVLTVPREAIIETGKRRVVLLALGDGRFQPAPVRTGMWTADKVEILSGLQPNAEVVVSGQFLIDSESNLQAALRRMQ